MYGIGKKIEQLRKEKNLTRDELAENTNISKQSIFNYETERRLIPIDALSQIANFFNVPIEAFFSENSEDFKNIKIEKNSVRIPIYPDASAGLGNYYTQEDPIDWLELPSSIAKNADLGAFVAGNSMEPKIYEDDLLLIRKTDFLEDGDIGVFYLNEDIYCKKFKYNPVINKLTLVSLNQEYAPIRIKEGDDFHIIGKVVGVIDYTI